MSKRIVLLQALASTPKDLTMMLKEMNDASIWERPKPNEWAIADVVNHLVLVEREYLKRLQRVLELERPSLPEILPNEREHDRQVALPDLIKRFEEARDETLALLKGIGPGGWQRPAVHETRGDVTLRLLVQFLVEHDIIHLNQVVDIQQRLRALPRRDAQPAIKGSA
jgi:uncharacterized damage-inducible protein DinB